MFIIKSLTLITPKADTKIIVKAIEMRDHFNYMPSRFD
jgi:hypothetical protein